MWDWHATIVDHHIKDKAVVLLDQLMHMLTVPNILVPYLFTPLVRFPFRYCYIDSAPDM